MQLMTEKLQDNQRSTRWNAAQTHKSADQETATEPFQDIKEAENWCLGQYWVDL